MSLLSSLRLKYRFEIESAKSNIEIYKTNPAGIGDHSDLVAAVDAELNKLAAAEDKLNCLIKNYPYEAHDENDPEDDLKNQETLFG